MTPRITKLSLSNFRSISGTVDLNLDAPVVLIHGPNGSGKTSLLSAIELGLTGAVASLRRFDPSYAKNLVHYDAKEARVSITCRHPELSEKPTDVKIRDGNISGEPLLSPRLRRFFSERSFLAQATLGRLLEIYENSDARDDQSPLTKFVKDLLGLDAVDNLIDGLHAAADKRRIRNSLPLYAETETHCRRLEENYSELQASLELAAEEVSTAEALFEQKIQPFKFDEGLSLDDVADALRRLPNEDSESIGVEELRREIVAAMSVLEKTDNPNTEAERSQAEAALSSARKAYSSWLQTNGSQIDAALQFAGESIATLPNPRLVGFVEACETAYSEIGAEAERVALRLQRDESARSNRENHQRELSKAMARATRLDERLSSVSEQSNELANVLSGLAVHIDSEICPVCQRDFSEVSEESLHAHVTKHIARLSRVAGELQELTSERRDAQRAIADAQYAIETHAAELLKDEERSDLISRRANLRDSMQKLQSVMSFTAIGDQLQEAVDSSSNYLSSIRQNEESVAGLRRSVAEYPARLGIDPALDEEPLKETFARCLAAVSEKSQMLQQREDARKQAIGVAQYLLIKKAKEAELRGELESIRQRLEKAKTSLDAADAIRSMTKDLSNRALSARTDIVRRVFNESLNQIWEELFIRLAPEEPFIPAFALPENSRGPVEARLETRYRGESGGNPKAMLSAGNLNTAALTLFLSLHLSVKPLLPWLVIDDPVQSMDEIHIAQFAALLRTLSKQHDRQIVIAVHEKPLFDYLALELSPASEGDRLATVELARLGTGKTAYVPEILTWDSSRVFQATG